jgi:hypothetical protein
MKINKLKIHYNKILQQLLNHNFFYLYEQYLMLNFINLLLINKNVINFVILLILLLNILELKRIQKEYK